MAEIHKLLNQARLIIEKVKVSCNESRLRGEQFNIFHACGVNHYETTHSTILAEFLNPEGSHGQGDTYLKEFLSVVGDIGFSSAFDTSESSVSTEYSTSCGRLDILISNSKGQAIIIENKIYAGDQWGQLKRYDNFASQKYHAGNYAILYLTLWGDEASEQSGEGVQYKCISYKDIIQEWLKRCIRISAQKPLIRETMIQYSNLIKELTNQTMDAINKNELLELMANNAEVVAEIFNNQSDYIKYTWENRIRPKLQEIATEKTLLYEEYNMTCQNRDGKSFTFRAADCLYTGIRFQSNTRSYDLDMFYGIVSLDGKHPGIQQKLNIFQEKPSNIWPYGYASLNKYRYWDMTSRAEIINNTDKFVNYIKEKIEAVLTELNQRGIKLE